MSLEQFIEAKWKPFVNTFLRPPDTTESASEDADPILGGLTISQFLVTDVKAQIMFDDECCILHVNVTGDHLDYLTVSLEELMLSRKKADCPRKGKDYLRILHMINEQFWSNRSIYDGFPYRRVIFKVPSDLSHIVGLRKFTLTQEMVDQTASLYWLMLDMEREYRDRGEFFNLAKAIKMESLRSHYLVKHFFELVLELNDLHTNVRFEDGREPKRISGISIRSGRVLVSDLVYVCFHINRDSPDVDRYVQRMWFELILPRIMENEEVTRRLTARSTSFHINISSFPEVPVKLAVTTLLARDDAKTWYMSDLQLSICSLGGREETYYTEKLREFQNMQRKDDKFRLSTNMKIGPNAKIHQLVNFFIVKDLRSMNGSVNSFSYFDAILYREIERMFMQYDGGLLYDTFTHNVCRVLYER